VVGVADYTIDAKGNCANWSCGSGMFLLQCMHFIRKKTLILIVQLYNIQLHFQNFCMELKPRATGNGL
jgi:hypothetical protein